MAPQITCVIKSIYEEIDAPPSSSNLEIFESSVPVTKHLTLLNRSSRIVKLSKALVAVAVPAAAAAAEVTPAEVLATDSFADPLSSFTLIVFLVVCSTAVIRTMR